MLVAHIQIIGVYDRGPGATRVQANRWILHARLPWILGGVGLLRMLAASVDELGELCAGALKERTQLALFLCIAMGATGCRHEEPCDFCCRAA